MKTLVKNMDKIGSKFNSVYISKSILDMVTTESRKTYKFWLVILVCFVGILSLLKVYSGMSPIWAPWDVINLLNGGWRIFNGQIPHTDFYNPIGVLTYIPTVIVMKIGFLSASSLVYGNVIFGLLLTFWTWIIAKNRISAFVSFVLSASIFVLTISTRPLGYGVTNTTYAMLYNRYGYVLLAMLLVQLFIPDRSSFKSKEIFNGLSNGILLAFLFYCKITFFIVGLGFIIIYILIFRFSIYWAAMSLGGFALVVISMLVIFHINIGDYFGNLYIAARSQSSGMRLGNIARCLKDNILLVYFSFLILLLAYISTIYVDKFVLNTRMFLKVSIVVTAIVASGILLSSGDAPEGNDVPIFFIAGIIILSYLPKLTDKVGSLTNNTRFMALFIILAGFPVLIGHIFMKDVASVAYTAFWNKTQLASISPSQRFQSNSLYDFVIPSNSTWETAYWRASDVPQRINEGLDLLKRHINKSSKIFCLCYTDPFTFGLGLAPVKGTPLWWDVNFSFNANNYPSPDVLFRNVNVVMIPIFTADDTGCCKDTVVLMEQIYDDYLAKNFSKEDESTHWILLQRY